MIEVAVSAAVTAATAASVMSEPEPAKPFNGFYFRPALNSSEFKDSKLYDIGHVKCGIAICTINPMDSHHLKWRLPPKCPNPRCNTVIKKNDIRAGFILYKSVKMKG